MFYSPVHLVNQFKEKGYFKEGEAVADFGCGSGYFTTAFGAALKGGKCFAFDIQPEAISAARSLAQKAGVAQNVIFKQVDLESPGATVLANESVGFVLISNLLYQVEGKEGVIREAARILKPMGFIAIIDWQPEKMIFKDNKSFAKESAKELLVGAGLKIVDEENLSYHYLIVGQKP